MDEFCMDEATRDEAIAWLAIAAAISIRQSAC